MSIFELDAWLNDKKEINQLKNNKISYNPFYFVSIGLLFITFFFGLVLWKKYKIKKSIVEQRFIETQLSETYLKEIIMSKKNILSVSDLAEELKTSTVQLNRKLARSNISALNILKETKKEIALEMYKNGNSISSISKRVGYSERFIKENFLK
jgi:AraC-like DNA-binding protein